MGNYSSHYENSEMESSTIPGGNTLAFKAAVRLTDTTLLVRFPSNT